MYLFPLVFIFLRCILCEPRTMNLVLTSIYANPPSLIGVKSHECIFKTRHRLLLWAIAWIRCWRHNDHVHPSHWKEIHCKYPQMPPYSQTISPLLQIFLLRYYFVFLCKYEKDVMFYSSEYLACELLLKLIVSFSQNQINGLLSGC